MVNQITVTGMVLAAAPAGEYDRRVVILTKERGKISAFARGARKPSSALVGMTSPFSFGEFTLYEGRTSYTLVLASISNYFAQLRSDMEGAYYGFYFLDLAGYYAREGNDEAALLGLLYQSLKALISPNIPNRLIRCVYELKAVCISGEGPQVFQCVQCGNTEGEKRFSIKRGGIVCQRCLERERSASSGSSASGGSACRDALPENTVELLPSTIYTMQYIISSSIEKLYTFAVTEEVLGELEKITVTYLEEYAGKRFKSLEILETII